MVYLLVINYYSVNLIHKLIDSLAHFSLPPYQLIIVNNSPGDLDFLNVDNSSLVILEANQNLGFGNACNLGLKWIYQKNKNAWVWLINPDTIFKEINLDQIESFFEQYPDISILGTIIYTEEETVWFGGGTFEQNLGNIVETNLFIQNPNQHYLKCDWVSGCSMIINLKNFQNCPQFDPEYFLYYEDFDFCQRYLKEGHQVAITNKLSVIHQPSSITNRNLTDKMFHSTFSYLLTLKKYTNLSTFMLKLTKLLINTIFLSLFKPSLAWGKLKGISYFFSPK